MPWVPSDAEKHKTDATKAEAKVWAKTANSALASCMSSGGTDKACSGKAIRIANSVVNKNRKGSSMSTEVLVMGDVDLGFEPGDEPWKESLITGSWEHPITGKVLDVDKARMDSWVETFHKMKKDGIEVPFTDGHSSESRRQLGDIVGMQVRPREDGKFGFWTQHSVPIAADMEKIGTTIKNTSVGMVRNITAADGNGGIREYGEGCNHIAATPFPVVHGQKPFADAPLSADDDPDVILMSRVVPEDAEESDPALDETTLAHDLKDAVAAKEKEQKLHKALHIAYEGLEDILRDVNTSASDRKKVWDSILDDLKKIATTQLIAATSRFNFANSKNSLDNEQKTPDNTGSGPDGPGTSTGDTKEIEMDKEFLASVQTAFDLPNEAVAESVTADDLAATIKAKQDVTSPEDASELANVQTELATVQTEAAAAKAELATAATAIEGLQADKAQAEDKEREQRLSTFRAGAVEAQSAGKMTKAMRTEIEAGVPEEYSRETFDDAVLLSAEGKLAIVQMLGDNAAVPAEKVVRTSADGSELSADDDVDEVDAMAKETSDALNAS